jgi:hypothetical protein
VRFLSGYINYYELIERYDSSKRNLLYISIIYPKVRDGGDLLRSRGRFLRFGRVIVIAVVSSRHLRRLHTAALGLVASIET